MENNAKQQENWISDVIVRKAGKNKFLEMYDSLTLANPQDYANVYGRGGKNHAPSAGIGIRVTDYTNKPAVMAQGQIPLFAAEQILEICRKNCGTTIVPLEVNMTEEITGLYVNAETAKASGLIKAIAKKIKAPETVLEAEVGKVLKEFLRTLSAGFCELPAFRAKKSTCDWNYTQSRVNVYSKNAEGYCRCSVISIAHQTYRPDGSESKLPWNIRVQNFMAKAQEAPNGTSSYISSTVKDKKDVNINLNNDDMWDAASTACHFADVWMVAMATNNIQKGEEARRQARIDAAAAAKGGAQ